MSMISECEGCERYIRVVQCERCGGWFCDSCMGSHDCDDISLDEDYDPLDPDDYLIM